MGMVDTDLSFVRSVIELPILIFSNGLPLSLGTSIPGGLSADTLLSKTTTSSFTSNSSVSSI